MSRRRPLLWGLGVLAVLVAYLTLFPTDVAPRAWQAPPTQRLEGVYASNGRLAKARVFAADLPGPEALWPEADGWLLTGTVDGRIVRVDPRTGRHETLASTGGRPLGLKRGPDGLLYIADGHRGLLRLNARNEIEALVSEYEGQPMRFADDLAPLPDGRVVFTEASTRFSLGEHELDAIEHSSNGRVFVYDPRTKQTSLLLDRLDFPNGVAAGRDGSFVMITETWAYRVRKLWLSGPRQGKSEIARDNLPGFPDNITYDAARDLFWVALVAPRDATLDALAPYPFARKMIARLPRAIRPKAKRHAMVVALRADGTVAQFLDDPRPDSYSPLTHAVAVGNTLHLGSFEHAGIGTLVKLDLPEAGVRTVSE